MWRVCFGRGQDRRTRIYRSHTKIQQGRNLGDEGYDGWSKEQCLDPEAGNVALQQDSNRQLDEDNQRDALILAATPACFTVVNLDDRRALRQNLTSRRWMGDRVNKRTAPAVEGQVGVPSGSKQRVSVGQRDEHEETAQCPSEAVRVADGEDLLALIFKYEPEALAGMLQELLNEGDVWKGVVRVPPFIRLSCSDNGAQSDSDATSSSAAADGAPLPGMEPPLSSVSPPTPLASSEYKSTGGAAAQQPLGLLRKLFQRISRGSRDFCTLTAIEAASWSAALAEQDGAMEVGGGSTADVTAGVTAGCELRSGSRSRRSLTLIAEQAVEASGSQQTTSGQDQHQCRTNRINSNSPNHAPNNNNAPAHRESKMMRLSDMMMSMLLEGEEVVQADLPMQPMRPPSVTRRTSPFSSVAAQNPTLDRNMGSGYTPGRVLNATSNMASSQFLNPPGKPAAAGGTGAAGGGQITNSVPPQRSSLSLPRRRSSGYVCVGAGGPLTLQGSDSFSRPTTATATSRSTPSATNPQVASSVMSIPGGDAGSAMAGVAGATAATPPAPPALRDANPLSTSTLTLSLVRRACMSNAATVEGEPSSQTESAFGSFTGSNMSRRGRLRRVVSCYDSRSAGGGTTGGDNSGAPNASNEESQGDDDEVDVSPLPGRQGSSMGTGLLSSLGVGETVHYVNASARLLTFAAHLKSAPMATQMLAGVAHMPTSNG
ncbi:hypothetical protein Vafri_11763, partial [Volvox africanus]